MAKSRATRGKYGPNYREERNKYRKTQSSDIIRDLEQAGRYIQKELIRPQGTGLTKSKKDDPYSFYLQLKGGEDYLAGLEQGLKYARKYLNSKSKISETLRKSLSVAFSVQIIRNFQDQTDSTGKKWPSLKPETLERRSRQSRFARTEYAKELASKIKKKRKKNETDRSYKARQKKRAQLGQRRVNFLEKSYGAQKLQQIEGRSKTLRTKAIQKIAAPSNNKTEGQNAAIQDRAERVYKQAMSTDRPLIDSGELFTAVTGSVQVPKYANYSRADAIKGEGAFDLVISANGKVVSFSPKTNLSKNTKMKIAIHNRKVDNIRRGVPGREFLYTSNRFQKMINNVLANASFAAGPDGEIEKDLRAKKKFNTMYAPKPQIATTVAEKRKATTSAIKGGKSLMAILRDSGEDAVTDKDLASFFDLLVFLEAGTNRQKIAKSTDRYLETGGVR